MHAVPANARATGSIACLLLLVGCTPVGDSDWPAYGGDAGKTRHSPLTQINRDNVAELTLAWSYDTGEKGDTQTQPIVIGGVMYAYTPTHKTIALDAATGRLSWSFDSGLAGVGANRGLMYWRDGREARLFAAVDNFIYALDAATGKPVTGFGRQGRIDLRENLGRDPATQSVRLTTPGVIFRDLMIVGGRVGESLPASPGHIRAYDVRSGALRWTFRTIPQPGEPGHDTWPPDAWQYTGGANSWPGMTLDEERGLVFVPTGSAAADFYGANRLGDNLYANCLLALEAATGKLRWHFQFVRHDVLDRDLPSAPTLVTLRVNGQSVDALAQTTKQGYVFVLERDSGRPLFPIEKLPAPASDVPGEATHPTY
ncbi:MAG TPA: PQQ-binding-like beta-propeller repeat protein, partial [Steroidobacteraceae bacterium]|nr:PQQ-binding-like beta-propeller repeat protein [Steroidobacteraceae bacterium]